MADRQQIEQPFIDIHNDITARYYQAPDEYPGGKAQFDLDHAKNWQDLENALTDAGYPPLSNQEDRLKDIENRLKILEDKQ